MQGDSPVVRCMLTSDWPAIHTIYAAGIATGQATFESSPPDWDTFDAAHLTGLRLVAAVEKQVLGWAAGSPVSARAVYKGVVEVSLYVAPTAQGRGIGRVLLRALAASAESQGIWTIQSSIFPENTASLTLHLTEGFRIVGRRVRLAQMTYGPHASQWRDTLLLERRSTIIGRA